MDSGKSAPDWIDESVIDLNRNLNELTDMAQVLGQDCTDQYLTIRDDNNQAHRRAYVRSVCALIEGILHRMKLAAAHLGMVLGTLSTEEIVVINEVAFDVNDKGEVVSRTVFMKFLNNVRFAFKVYSKSIGSSFELRVDGSGWQNLLKCVSIRDRLMHPKASADLTVSDAEVEASKSAFDWFFTSYVLCSHYAQKASQAKTSPSLEDIANLNAKILDFETKLARNGG